MHLVGSSSAAAHSASTRTPFPWKPLSGSFIDVAYDDRLRYANTAAHAFSCATWSAKIKEWGDAGLDTVIFQAVHDARWGAYYSSTLPNMTLWSGACSDVVGAVLDGAESMNMSVYLSCEYVGTERDGLTPPLIAARVAILDELARKYGARASYAGFYFASEAHIAPLFDPSFIAYCATLSGAMRAVTPHARTLISPYGTRSAVSSGTYVAQLRALAAAGVDTIAYQDEVGCVRDELPIATATAAWATLAAAHAAAGGLPALWANVEAFTWEDLPNNDTSPLIPAPWPRLLAQIAAAAPHVDKVLTFSAEALLDAPGSRQRWGPPSGDAQRAWTAWQDSFPPRGGSPSSAAAALLADAVGARALAHSAIGANVTVAPLPLPAFAPSAARAIVDGRTGAPSPFGDAAAAWVAWRAASQQRIDIVVDLGAPTRVSNAAVHALAVGPRWYLNGHGRGVKRNLTARTPAAVRFFGSDAALPPPLPPARLSRGLAPHAPGWHLLGEVTVESWSQEVYDVRTELVLWEANVGTPAALLPCRWLWAAVVSRHGAAEDEVVLLSELAVNALPSRSQG